MQDIIVWVIVSCCIGYAARNFSRSFQEGKRNLPAVDVTARVAVWRKKSFGDPEREIVEK